jgi:hypothetical protein
LGRYPWLIEPSALSYAADRVDDRQPSLLERRFSLVFGLELFFGVIRDRGEACR